MSQLKCTICGYPTPVSAEDPDSSLSDAFDHVQRRHADELALLRKKPVEVVQLVDSGATVPD